MEQYLLNLMLLFDTLEWADIRHIWLAVSSCPSQIWFRGVGNREKVFIIQVGAYQKKGIKELMESGKMRINL